MAWCPWCGAELVPPYRFCSKCGQPVASGSPRGALRSGAYGGPSVPRDNSLLLAVASLLVVVAVSIASAGVLYLGVVRLASSYSSQQKPTVTMSLTYTISTGAEIWLTSVQPASPTANLRVNLGTNGSSGNPTPISAAGTPAYVYLAGWTYTVTWENPGGSGQLMTGDQFIVAYPFGGAPAAGSMLTFFLLWSDGSTLASVTWLV